MTTMTLGGITTTVPEDDCVDEETTECNVDVACAGWGEWSDFGDCSATCTEPGHDGMAHIPTQIRTRCWNDGVNDKCNDCDNDECLQTESSECNNIACPCVWNEWLEWGGCTPSCRDGLKLRRRTGSATCVIGVDGATVESSTCEDDHPEECPTCNDKYDKCDQIDVSFCAVDRYAAQLEMVCNKHCGYCNDDRRKRRSNRVAPFKFQHIDDQTFYLLEAIFNV